MAALDTNALVRYLVKDDLEQFNCAYQLITQQVQARQRLFVPITVVLELEWVLRSRYKLAKQVITDTYTTLLSTTELQFESESALELALFYYKMYTADFADCLHVALAAEAGHAPLHTFDKRAACVPETQLIG
ncbi:MULTISPECIES: type II toxin-antitoxin system VapC family toxin [Burkholderiaceae]|nr:MULTISPECIES: type II toxin-antitoxin system VapC family toxin [Burkholderiaceae]MCF2133921.1 type II toxin-antitoxin system VapC family toxin [Mycetohabitans sp. B3]MCG1019836.1 type II toxin-antitoxin system VapC family toxin [Mycetohabitans sp. B4]MCG1040705.1 type II toxin-antitoxin system VapC family toxin [Mycetohabitans sp. B7]SIT65483.1 Predicted nucleic-acid-binding protein, contains PIN domain [Burkholderia sp. b14]SIT80525.1 Predicted nucleic-acid-binding protein, contains PIN do